jgi:hypothetical protein
MIMIGNAHFSLSHHQRQPQHALDCGVFGFDGRKDCVELGRVFLDTAYKEHNKDIDLAFRVCFVVSASCTAVHLVEKGSLFDAFFLASACVSSYHRNSTMKTSETFKDLLRGQKRALTRKLYSETCASDLPSDPASMFRNMILETIKKVRVVERSPHLPLEVRNAFHALHIALSFIDLLVRKRFNIHVGPPAFRTSLAENWGGIFYRD